MSVSAQLLRQPDYRYLHIRSGFEWSSYSLDNLAIEKFYDFRFAKVDSTLTVYAGGPEDSEEEKTQFVEGVFKGAVINQDYLEEDVIDFSKMVTDIRLFISHNGAYLLQQYKKLVIGKNQLAIFIEIPDGDVFSKQVMLIKAGENAKKYSEVVFKHYMDLEYFTLTKEQTKQLISSAENGKALWDQVISFTLKPVDLVVELSIDLFGFLAELIEKSLRIEEKRWNTGAKDYTLEKLENQIVNFLSEQEGQMKRVLEKQPNLPVEIQNLISSLINDLSETKQLIENHKDKVQKVWAFLCGLWNGLIDLISGVLSLIKLVFQAIELQRGYIRNKAYFKQLAWEQIDNLVQAIADTNFKELIKTSWDSATNLVEEAKDKIDALNLNPTEIEYYSGYLVFNILEWAFPLLKLGKAGKGEKAAGALEEAVVEATKNARKGIKEGRDAAEILNKNADEVVEALKKENEALKKQIDETFTGVRNKAEEASKSKTEKIIDDVKSKKERLEVDAKGKRRKSSDFTRHANYAEMLANEKWIKMELRSNGKKVKFKALHQLTDDLDAPVRKGIDGIFENELFDGKPPPPKYIINEVKHNTTSSIRTPGVWRSKLEKTKHGIQMGDKWIERNLKEIPMKVKDDIKIYGYEAYLTGISKNGSKIELFELINNAKNIISTKL